MATEQSKNDQFDKEKIKQALRETDGIKSAACKKIGCSRPTLDRYIETYDDVYEVWYESNEQFVDVLELKYKKIIQDEGHPNHWNAVRFGLQTKGKARGWSEGYEVTYDKERLEEDTQELDYSKLTPEEIEQFDRLLSKAAGEVQVNEEDAGSDGGTETAD